VDQQRDPVTAVGALGDELRRGMYGFIRRARRPVTRDEAAASVGISRKLAAFHLDKLVDVGLLRTRADAPGRVRTVGRAPKLYEPVPDQIHVSIPERRHELLAEILADAVLTETGERTARESAFEAADRRGNALGNADRDRHRPGRLGTERTLTLAAETLEDLGFEPERAAPALLLLRNCPFHPLAAKAPDLVCGINHRFLGGYLQGLGAADAATAVLQPEAGSCCVRLCAADVSGAGPDGAAAEQ
jgi:predicted ArsR family transcriptional regulator